MLPDTNTFQGLSMVVERDGEPRLRGGECISCGEPSLPVERCPSCGAQLQDIVFEPRAELETYTVVHVAPEKFDTPYAIGYVYLQPGNVRAFTPLVGDASEFSVGMTVELVTATVGGQQTWAFTKAGDRDA